MNHFPKILSWWNPRLKRVEEVFKDIDVTGTASKEAAKAIQNSFKKIFPEEGVKLHGIVTNSGGGGTLGFLAAELDKLGL